MSWVKDVLVCIFESIIIGVFGTAVVIGIYESLIKTEGLTEQQAIRRTILYVTIAAFILIMIVRKI